MDGSQSNTKWHNAYLDGYIPLRAKSIYDPCPYLYRIPSNGTYNQFTSNPACTEWSHLGGYSWNLNTLGESWLSGLGWRNWGSGIFEYTGGWGFYRTSTTGSQSYGYVFRFNADKEFSLNRIDYQRSIGLSVRCIEDTRRYAHTFLSKKVCKKPSNVTFVAPKVTKMPKAKSTSASL